MSTKRLSWNSSPFLVVVALLAFVLAWLPRPASADDFSYFGKGIDFWNETTPGPKTVVTTKSATSASVVDAATGDKSKGGASMGSAFPWHQYLDPKNKEFFKEGDYTPPEPFMELVRNPSDQNLKMWFHYIERKNELSARLQARMQEYLAKNGASVPAEGRDVMMKRVAALPKSPPDSKRFVFRMYFDSKCPHCKRMFETLSELQRIGFYVDARQVDSDPKGLQGLPVPAKRAEEAEIKSQKITGVPLLLAGDLKTKTAYRIQGYQTVSQVLGALPKEEN